MRDQKEMEMESARANFLIFWSSPHWIPQGDEDGRTNAKDKDLQHHGRTTIVDRFFLLLTISNV